MLDLLIEIESLGTNYVPDPGGVSRTQRNCGELGDLGICELLRRRSLRLLMLELGHLL